MERFDELSVSKGTSFENMLDHLQQGKKVEAQIMPGRRVSVPDAAGRVRTEKVYHSVAIDSIDPKKGTLRFIEPNDGFIYEMPISEFEKVYSGQYLAASVK